MVSELSACKISRGPLRVNKKHAIPPQVKSPFLLEPGAAKALQLFFSSARVPTGKYARMGAAERIPAAATFSREGNSLHTSNRGKNFNRNGRSPLFIPALGIITSHRFSCKERTMTSLSRMNY